MKTGKVTSIVGDGTYKELNKWKVNIDNGDSLTFFSKKEFRKSVGDVIQYEITNEKYGIGKLAQDKPAFVSKDDLILRQVAFKGAIELATTEKITLDAIEQYTNNFFNILKQ
jgi:hypothetical protein|tara:strand:+ start:336 stop:671 length:336 start_codon:yes stop_codon:yes gene_type:complete